MRKLLLILSVAVFATASGAQNKIVPIVDFKVGGLLGGIENGKYLNARETVDKLSAEADYTLYLPGGKSEKLRLKKPANTQEICDDFYGLDASDATDRHETGVALGAGFTWNPQPRVVKRLALDDAANLKIMRAFLRTQRITFALPKLTQAFRADLDGDGRDEIILAATRVSREVPPKRRAKRDEFSVVLIRKIVNGKPRNIMVSGEFVPKSDALYDGYTYEISSIADLNGDRRMEIVLHGEYYEGSHSEVFEVRGGKAENVEGLHAGCGI